MSFVSEKVLLFDPKSFRRQECSLTLWSRNQHIAWFYVFRALLRRVSWVARKHLPKENFTSSWRSFLQNRKSNRKLIHWRFVLHGRIKGYSRAIVYIKCFTNNVAGTALQCFTDGIQEFGVPSRVRSDRGAETWMLLDLWLIRRGFIAGRSTHNQRIQRLCAEVNIYIDLFVFMENTGILDAHDELFQQSLPSYRVYIPYFCRFRELCIVLYEKYNPV